MGMRVVMVAHAVTRMVAHAATRMIGLIGRFLSRSEEPSRTGEATYCQAFQEHSPATNDHDRTSLREPARGVPPSAWRDAGTGEDGDRLSALLLYH
jgi:hypothetical protein